LAREAGEEESTPVKETRTIDPATGEVSLKIEGREQDLSAANPLTPTVVQPQSTTPEFNFRAQPQVQAPTQPIAPPAPATAMQPRPQPAVQQPQAQAQSVAAPAVPAPMPNAVKPPGQPIMDDTGRVIGYETPQQMLNNMVSGAAVGANPVVPVNPAAPVNPAQMQPVPGAPAATTPLQQTVTEPAAPVMAPWQQELLDAQNDKQKLYAYLANKEHPAEARAVADNLLKKQYAQEAGQAETEKMLMGFVKGDAKAQSDIIKKLKSKDEEGSYVKAYIFGRLGLTKLADEEQAKLAGPKFERVIVDGQSYLAETNSKGGITGAYDAAGKSVDNATLARINAGAAKFGTHAFGFTGGSLTIPEGQPNAGQEYRQRTNAQTGQIENIITTGPDAGKLYTGAPGYEKRVTSQALIGQNQLIFDLQKKHGNNVLDALKDFEGRKRVLTPEERQDFFNLYGSQNPTIQKPFIPGVTPPANPQQKMSLPSESTLDAMTPAVYNPNQTGGMMQTRMTPEELSTPVETIKQQQEIQKDIAKKAGTQPIESAGAGTTETAKSKAKRVETLPAREDDARRVLRTIDEVINHPGFEISTGMSAPIGSIVSIIPGTAARDWQAKYKELQGQNFLEAYANLRGTGAISEKEGSKAQQAIAALSDPGISESEFKRNAELLKNDVRRRIDTERKSLGMKPLDWKQIETDMKKETMSQRDRDALDWAERNPRDPRADKIRKELGM